MSSSPLNLPCLKQLADQGFNTGVLAVIEHQAMSQAMAMRRMKGFATHTLQEVTDLAERVLPQGAALMAHYTEKRGQLENQKVAELEEVSRSLTTYAAALEGTAVRVLATAPKLTLRENAEAQQVVGERYARLLEAADALDVDGLSTSARTRLSNLRSPPQGPLSAFYEKACAIAADRQQRVSPRMRMVG